MANLISCDNLLGALKTLVGNMSEEDRAYLCEHLNCANNLEEIVSAVEPNLLSVAADGKLLVIPTPSKDLVSAEADNSLALGADGKLYIKLPKMDADALVSQDAGNIIIQGSDGLLYARVEPTPPVDMISEDEGNSLVTGKDGGLYVNVPEPDALLSKMEGNSLTAMRDGLYAHVPVTEELISQQAGNTIVKGPDNKLYSPELNVGSLVSPEQGNQLGVKDGALLVPAVVPSDMVSAESRNIISTSAEDNKLTVKTATVQTIVQDWLANNADDIVSEQEGNMVELDREGRLYVSEAEIDAKIDAYEPEATKLLSDDEDNYSVAGSDGKVYTPTPEAADFLSPDKDNILRLSGNNDKITLTAAEIGDVAKGVVTPESLVSLRPGNNLGVDDTNKLFVTTTISSPVTLISSQEGNMLTTGVDGDLFVPAPAEVSPVDLVSKESGNLIKVTTDNKIVQKAGDLVSGNSGNSLQAGTDGKLYVPAPEDAASLVSTSSGSLVKVDDGKISLKAADLISTNAGNGMQAGTDGKLFVPAPENADSLVSTAGDSLVNVVNGKISLTAADIISTDANNNIVAGSDGKVFSEKPVVFTTTDPGEGVAAKPGQLIFVLSN
ncbi:MAG: hypothetical protein NC080_07485 [Paraprevotella sp.]|nr:hypothetical protein [Paraprevotella sp.]